MALSDKAGELELIDLPMLPSLASNSSISECYERDSGSDTADRPGEEATRIPLRTGAEEVGWRMTISI